MEITDKKEIRKAIAAKKKTFTKDQLAEWSASLWEQIETHPLFQRASAVLLYYSLPDEVQTHRFIDKWSREKTIILPVVTGNDLELYRYEGKENLHEGSFHIQEPGGTPISDETIIDLVLVPGVAFDAHGNRLGRGKGFYDRLLKRIGAPKIGICYSFQVCPALPVEPFDIPMNEVWTENGPLF